MIGGELLLGFFGFGPLWSHNEIEKKYQLCRCSQKRGGRRWILPVKQVVKMCIWNMCSAKGMLFECRVNTRFVTWGMEGKSSSYEWLKLWRQKLLSQVLLLNGVLQQLHYGLIKWVKVCKCTTLIIKRIEEKKSREM